MVHKNPDCNVCAPKCFWGCGKDYSMVYRDTHSSSTDHSLASNSGSGSRRPQTNTDVGTPSVDYKMFWYRGKPQGRWSCSVCGLSDKSIKMVMDHIQSSHVISTIFRCRFCNATYNDAQKLYRHQKIIHKTTVPLKCPNCLTIYHNRGI